MMKLLFAILGTVLLISCILNFASPCHAENALLKQECENKAEKTAELILQLGAEVAFEKITDLDGTFVGKNSHVFCIDSDTGQLLAHKVARFVGVNMHYYRDADKKTAYTEILNKAASQPNGWSTHMTYGSGPEKRQIPGLKNMYFFKIPGKNIVLCCGYWNDAQ